MDVEDGRVVERDADGLQLGRERAGKSLGEPHVAAAAEGGHRRPLGERRLEPRDAPALLIDADPERQLRDQTGRVVAQLGDLFRFRHVAREENDAAQAELAGERPSSTGTCVPVEPGDQQLSDLAAERARRHACVRF